MQGNNWGFEGRNPKSYFDQKKGWKSITFETRSSFHLIQPLRFAQHFSKPAVCPHRKNFFEELLLEIKPVDEEKGTFGHWENFELNLFVATLMTGIPIKRRMSKHFRAEWFWKNWSPSTVFWQMKNRRWFGRIWFCWKKKINATSWNLLELKTWQSDILIENASAIRDLQKTKV